MRVACLAIFFCLLIPASASAHWLFSTNMSPARQDIFLDAVSNGNHYARSLANAHNNQIVIRASKKATNYSYAHALIHYRGKLRYGITYDANHLLLDEQTRDNVVWHEIGHIIDFAGLSNKAMHRIMSGFHRSSRWKSCFHYDGRCVNSREIFAEQFAYWATGNTDIESGYGIPVLMNRQLFTRQLRTYYHYYSTDYHRWHGGWAFRP